MNTADLRECADKLRRCDYVAPGKAVELLTWAADELDKRETTNATLTAQVKALEAEAVACKQRAQAAIREAVAKEREEIAVLVQSAKFHEYVVNRIPFTHGLAEAIRARGGEL